MIIGEWGSLPLLPFMGKTGLFLLLSTTMGTIVESGASPITMTSHSSSAFISVFHPQPTHTHYIPQAETQAQCPSPFVQWQHWKHARRRGLVSASMSLPPFSNNDGDDGDGSGEANNSNRDHRLEELLAGTGGASALPLRDGDEDAAITLAMSLGMIGSLSSSGRWRDLPPRVLHTLLSSGEAGIHHILGLIKLQGHSFEGPHCVAALRVLTRHGDTLLTKDRRYLMTQWPAIQVLLQRIQMSLPSLSSTSLALVTRALSILIPVIRSPSPSFFPTLLSTMRKKLTTFNPTCFVQLLRALPLLPTTPNDSFLVDLLVALPLSEFTLPQLAHVTHGLARLNARPSTAFLDRLTLAASLALEEYGLELTTQYYSTGGGLSSSVLLSGQMGGKDEVMDEEEENDEEVTPQHLTDLVEGLSKLVTHRWGGEKGRSYKVPGGLLEAFSAAAELRVGSFTPQQLAVTITSLDSLSLLAPPPPPLPPTPEADHSHPHIDEDWASALAAASSSSPSSDLVLALSEAATVKLLTVPPPPSSSSSSSFHRGPNAGGGTSVRPLEMGEMLSGLNHLMAREGHPGPERELVRAFKGAALSHLRSFSPHALALALEGLQGVDLRGEPRLVDGLVSEVMRRLGEFNDPHDLAAVLEGLPGLVLLGGKDTGMAWKSMLAHVVPHWKKGSFTPSELVKGLTGLVKLHRPWRAEVQRQEEMGMSRGRAGASITMTKPAGRSRKAVLAQQEAALLAHWPAVLAGEIMRQIEEFTPGELSALVQSLSFTGPSERVEEVEALRRVLCQKVRNRLVAMEVEEVLGALEGINRLGWVEEDLFQAAARELRRKLALKRFQGSSSSSSSPGLVLLGRALRVLGGKALTDPSLIPLLEDAMVTALQDIHGSKEDDDDGATTTSRPAALTIQELSATAQALALDPPNLGPPYLPSNPNLLPLLGRALGRHLLHPPRRSPPLGPLFTSLALLRYQPDPVFFSSLTRWIKTGLMGFAPSQSPDDRPSVTSSYGDEEDLAALMWSMTTLSTLLAPGPVASSSLAIIQGLLARLYVSQDSWKPRTLELFHQATAIAQSRLPLGPPPRPIRIPISMTTQSPSLKTLGGLLINGLVKHWGADPSFCQAISLATPYEGSQSNSLLVLLHPSSSPSSQPLSPTVVALLLLLPTAVFSNAIEDLTGSALLHSALILGRHDSTGWATSPSPHDTTVIGLGPLLIQPGVAVERVGVVEEDFSQELADVAVGLMQSAEVDLELYFRRARASDERIVRDGVKSSSGVGASSSPSSYRRRSRRGVSAAPRPGPGSRRSSSATTLSGGRGGGGGTSTTTATTATSTMTSAATTTTATRPRAVQGVLEVVEEDHSGELEALTVVELKGLLRERGLRVTGRKAELVERLLRHTTTTTSSSGASEEKPDNQGGN